MRSICVFCGSSPGNRPEYMDLARQTGRLLRVILLAKPANTFHDALIQVRPTGRRRD